MSAAKRNSWTISFLGSLFRGRMGLPPGSWPYVLFAALVLALVIAAHLAWKKWGTEISADAKFRLSLNDVQITPQPKWIAGDVRSEVFQDSALGELSVLDPQTTEKVANAFARHSWVEKVKSVTKSAGPRVVVELEYRRPVAMVEVWSDGAPGLWAIDGSGVLLPTAGFESKTQNYLRIRIEDLQPFRAIGVPWADQRVLDAAKIAQLWADDWQKAGLYRIVAVRQSARGQQPHVYELHTRSGTRVIWGQAPDSETAEQIPASQKLAKLLQHVSETGRLDKREPTVIIDLRSGRVQPVLTQPPLAPQRG